MENTNLYVAGDEAVRLHQEIFPEESEEAAVGGVNTMRHNIRNDETPAKPEMSEENSAKYDSLIELIRADVASESDEVEQPGEDDGQPEADEDEDGEEEGVDEAAQ